jgi:hypothetical protein
MFAEISLLAYVPKNKGFASRTIIIVAAPVKRNRDNSSAKLRAGRCETVDVFSWDLVETRLLTALLAINDPPMAVAVNRAVVGDGELHNARTYPENLMEEGVEYRHWRALLSGGTLARIWAASESSSGSRAAEGMIAPRI